MPYFYKPAERTPKELFPGAAARTFWGEKVLFSYLDLEPGSYVPPHSHPHEQAGIVLLGELEFTIGDETQVVKEGEIFIIPGGVVHSVKVGDQPARALDVFSPVREEYKW
ncbi:MAG TPA: cupin domain-containing protein [Caldilineaceae bacterium]|nr:cupin domain-containing protein [Caldilineaceae bacterium]HRW03937.1 cupin domain-containing protein [Caldilineaceae bacterium]